MLATVELPDRLGPEHLDAVTNVIRDFQAERARFEQFAKELATEWQQVCGDLNQCVAGLKNDEEVLARQSRDIATEKSTVEERLRQAQVNADALQSTREEMEQYRGQLERMQRERIAVQRHLNDFQTNMATLSELMQVVHSTQEEFSRIHTSIDQQAHSLLAAIVPPTTESSRQLPPRSFVSTSEEVTPPESQEHRPELGAATHADEVGSSSVESSDPVLGSVLAELSRLRKP